MLFYRIHSLQTIFLEISNKKRMKNNKDTNFRL